MTPELRQRITAEWRGLPQKTERADRLRALSETLPAVMAKLGLSERLNEAQVLSAWKAIVGDFLASHSSPAALRDGVLIVQVLQPTVHYELDRVWKKELLKKLKARFGARAVRDIKFRVG
jgi:predicted nucleic acid-binding Zn ribbon protein